MNKGLEAFEEVLNSDYGLGLKLDLKNQLIIIEKELKEGSKYKQAIGIIAKQHLIGGLICTLQATKNYEEFNRLFINQYTKEEYDLFKEVLL